MSFCHHLIVLKLSLSINPYFSDFSSLMSLCCVTVADAFVAAATQEHNGAFLHFCLHCDVTVKFDWKRQIQFHPPTAAWTHTHIRVCVCVCVSPFIFFSGASQMLVCHINIHRCFEGLQIKAEFTECMFRHARLHCRDMRDKRAVISTGGVDVFCGVFDETSVLWGIVLAAFTQSRPKMSWLQIQEKLNCRWLLPRLCFQVLLTLKCLYALKYNKLSGFCIHVITFLTDVC